MRTVLVDARHELVELRVREVDLGLGENLKRGSQSSRASGSDRKWRSLLIGCCRSRVALIV